MNLSNGSSDFKDEPFTDKINELIANGVVVISAIGNEGPFQGTLNNPGDMVNVLGVGSLDETGTNVASFSSRGMTTWDLLGGNGIIKPDILTFGTSIKGLSNLDDETCTISTGTSVSSSIISACTALALSQITDEAQRKELQNGAYVKEALLNSASKLPGLSVTEQGAGVFDFDNFMRLIGDFDNEAIKRM